MKTRSRLSWLPGQVERSSQRKEREDFDGSAPYYIDVDSGQVELVAHARAAGLENLPPSMAQVPTDAEGAIEREYARQHRKLATETKQQLQALAANFDRLERSLPAARDVRAVEEDSRAAIEHLLGGDHVLVPLRQHQQRRRREQRAFERSHGLTEPARYPLSRLHHLGVLGPLVLVESALNASFFAATNGLGLVGGALVAVGVALVNVVLGAVAGFFARWRNHRTPRLRRLATCIVIGYAVLTIAFNLGVGHMRDQLAGAATLQVGEIVQHPFELSFASAVLVVVGVLASVMALRKGYTLDARVPGHGDADRAFRTADQALSGHQQSLRREVLGHAQRVPEECRRIVGEGESGVEQMTQTATQALHVAEAYGSGRVRAELWCNQRLHQWRSENLAVRSTVPPGYFDSYPTFPVLVEGDPIPKVAARLQAARERLEELKAEAHRIGLDQPTRVAAARDRFEVFMRESLRRADAGRGDGSTDASGAIDREGTAA
jgi:predicted phage tail protein